MRYRTTTFVRQGSSGAPHTTMILLPTPTLPLNSLSRDISCDQRGKPSLDALSRGLLIWLSKMGSRNRTPHLLATKPMSPCIPMPTWKNNGLPKFAFSLRNSMLALNATAFCNFPSCYGSPAKFASQTDCHLPPPHPSYSFKHDCFAIQPSTTSCSC